MKDNQNNEFAISAINFDIESLKLKIEYLRKLKDSSSSDQNGKVKGQYDKYFSDLKNKFS